MLLTSIHSNKIKLLLPMAKMKQLLPDKMRIVYSVTTTWAHFLKNNYMKRKVKRGMRVVKLKKSRETPQNHGGHMPVAAAQFTTEGTFTLCL